MAGWSKYQLGSGRLDSMLSNQFDRLQHGVLSTVSLRVAVRACMSMPPSTVITYLLPAFPLCSGCDKRQHVQ
jgi:hypothetical protein